MKIPRNLLRLICKGPVCLGRSFFFYIRRFTAIYPIKTSYNMRYLQISVVCLVLKYIDSSLKK